MKLLRLFRVLLPVTCALAWSISVSAQVIDDKKLRGGVVVGTGFTFNLDDVFLGANAGVCLPDYKTTLMVGFDGRLGSKKVEVEETQNLIYVLRERRYLLTLVADQRITLFGNERRSLDAFGRVGVGITFGDFQGTDWKPYSGILVSPAAGVALSFRHAVMRLGYQYLPTQTISIPPHRILAGVTFELFNDL